MEVTRVPSAAAHDFQIFSIRTGLSDEFLEFRGIFRGNERFLVIRVAVCTPFPDISMHVADPPRIGLKRPRKSCVLERTGEREGPGILFVQVKRLHEGPILIHFTKIRAEHQIRQIFPGRIECLGTRPAGVLPLRFGRKKDLTAGVCRLFVRREFRIEPLGEFLCVVPRDVHDWELFILPVSDRKPARSRSRSLDVPGFQIYPVSSLTVAFGIRFVAGSLHEASEHFKRDFRLKDPESVRNDRFHLFFVKTASLFCQRTSHLERAGRTPSETVEDSVKRQFCRFAGLCAVRWERDRVFARFAHFFFF